MKDLTCLRTITGRRTSLVRAITGFRRTARVAVIATFAGLLSAPSPALAWDSSRVSLGAARSFAVLGGPAVTCTGSVVTGDVGVALSTAFTNTGCTIAGNIHAEDVVAAQAYNDFLSASDALALTRCDQVLTATTLGSQTFSPGVYCFEAALTSTGSVLTLKGPSDGSWIFKIGTLGTGALTGTSFSVVMANGVQPRNVYWQVAEAATMTDSNFVGTILAGTAITITRGSLVGRALAEAAVTLTGVAVSKP